MSLKFRRILGIGVMAVGLVLLPALSKAEGYRPTEDGGVFGLGLELGDPGTWGITGKIWMDQKNAFQPAVKFNSGGSAILQLDYLWHYFNLVEMKEGRMPLYIGAGGNLLLGNTLAAAARLPLGISYIFDKKNVPLDLYFQVVPTLWFFDFGTSLNLYPELGAHFYF